MSVSLSIHPLSEHLDMYGQPDSNSGYSLAGHVSVSLTSPYSLFERRRTARFLLQSLSLTFEGQTEVCTSDLGYSAVRLCSITRELVSAGPVEMSNEDHEDSDEPCVWNIVFDLPIPGWLPETMKVGFEEVLIRYTLYATAKFTSIDEDHGSSWGFASLCSPFRSRVKTILSSQQIPLRRFASAPAVEMPPPPSLNFLVNSHASTSEPFSTSIPVDILSKIRVLASVPEYINMDDDSLPLTIRMRTAGMDEADYKRIQVTEISVDIIQKEKCRQRPSSGYLNRYPVPPSQMQPPNMRLREPHPMSTAYDVGLYVSADPSDVGSRVFSLLPSADAGIYTLPENNYVFEDGKLDETIPTWYTMETTVPFVKRSPVASDSISERTAPKLRATASTPLYTVYHDVSVALTCSYDMPDNGLKLKERLTFYVPVVFAKVAPALPPPTRRASPLFCEPLETLPASPPSLPVVLPYAQNLPSYSQLYHSNGDRKIDYSVPLPVYSPRASSPDISGSGVDPVPFYGHLPGSEKLDSHILISPSSDIRP